MNKRLYTNRHQWIIKDDKLVTIGISDFLQEKLGAIIFVNLPEIGDYIIIGKKYGDLESKKTVMDLDSPVSGSVVAVNEELFDNPELINSNPHDSWLIKVEYEDIESSLMDENQYRDHIDKPWMRKN